MLEIYASDQSLLHVALERGNLEHEDDRAGLTELLVAVEALTAGWLEPLGLGFQVVYCDPAQYFDETGRPPAPHHFLRSMPVSDDVLVWAAYSNSVVEIVPRIDASVVHHAIMRGLDQAPPAGQITTLSELQWTAVRALAPTTDQIRLDVTGCRVSTVEEVSNGQLWYCGPTAGRAGPPAWLRAVNDHFATRIQLSVFWDLWIGHAAGRSLLETGVSRVLARAGWEPIA